jgi:large subunit ribosomal protein L37Ae
MWDHISITMAKKTDKLQTTKRFGARYGPRNKIKMDKIERVQRSKQKCPYCLYQKVRRVTLGVWQCHKCNAKFTSKAYMIVAPPKNIISQDEDEE